LKRLKESGYRTCLDSYRAVGGVRGYIHLLDEWINHETIKKLDDKFEQGFRPMPKGWGVGLGIYKRLWNIESIPTYPTALKSIKTSLDTDQLRRFQEEGLIAQPKRTNRE